MKSDLMNMIDTVERGVEKLKPVLKQYIQDSSVPLEDRWEVYSKTPSYFFDSDYSYAHYTFGGKEIVWYDDHNIDRYQTADNVDVIEKYERFLEDGPWKDSNVTKEKIDNLKEQMLQSGIRTWVNDW